MFKRILNWIIFLFTGKGEILNEAIDEGLVDLSGQGRDKYGKADIVSTCCMHGPRFDDLSGKTFGTYKVIEFDHAQRVGKKDSTLTYYKCECQVCGRIFVRSRSTLLKAQGVRHRGKCE